MIRTLAAESGRHCPKAGNRQYHVKSGMNRKSEVVMRLAEFAVCVLLAGPTAAQTVVHSFEGDHGPGRAVCETGVTHCGFPDMNAGVNGKQVVQVTWQNVTVYD